MKLLVFAQVPPPVHGQSIMVRTLVEGLAATSDTSGGAGEITGGAGEKIEVIHVNPALSRDAADIGRARPGKFFALWLACWRALLARVRRRGKGGVTLYYVPAPGKRVAVWRDWMVMFALRPFFTRLVLHWHAAGLGAWLSHKARAPERWLTRLALGRADLSIVLAPELAKDALAFAPKKVRVVANGVDVDVDVDVNVNVNVDANAAASTPPPDEAASRPVVVTLLYLGTCSREKGLFAALDALEVLHGETPGAFELVIAGAFASAEEERAFNALLANDCAYLRGFVRCTGPADDAQKHALYAGADVFVFPTRYAHEAQPLVLIEAMAHDLCIVTTRWRAIPGMLPAGSAHARLVAPHAMPGQLAAAIRAVASAGAPRGTMRAHYENHFTRDAHLAKLAGALREMECVD